METHAKNLEDKAKALKNAYSRDWYKKHPGKHQEYQKRYWLRKAIQAEQSKPGG